MTNDEAAHGSGSDGAQQGRRRHRRSREELAKSALTDIVPEDVGPAHHITNVFSS